jgi:L-ribulokinase
MFAAVVADIYPTVEEAMAAMGKGFDVTYYPNKSHADIYRKRYANYNKLGEFVAGQVKAYEVVS